MITEIFFIMASNYCLLVGNMSSFLLPDTITGDPPRKKWEKLSHGNCARALSKWVLGLG